MRRIFVADDDIEILAFYKMILESAGYQVATADDGMEALKMCQAEDYELYVLDVGMPWLDGYSLANTLSMKFPGRKILMVTSRNFEKDKLPFKVSGASAFLQKPVDPQKFLATVSGLLAEEKGF